MVAVGDDGVGGLIHGEGGCARRMWVCGYGGQRWGYSSFVDALFLVWGLFFRMGGFLVGVRLVFRGLGGAVV